MATSATTAAAGDAVIQSLVTESLFARSETLDLIVSDLTIQLPTSAGVTVNASTAMSACAPGAKILVDTGRDWIGGRIGECAAAIYAYTRRSKSGVETVNPSVSLPVNQRRITRCLSVTFRAAARLSEIYSVAQVAVFDPIDLQIATEYKGRVAVIFDPNGWIRYVHIERTPGPKFRTSDAQFRREALATAQRALSTGQAKLRAMVMTGAPPRPGIDRVNVRTKQIARTRIQNTDRGAVSPVMAGPAAASALVRD